MTPTDEETLSSAPPSAVEPSTAAPTTTPTRVHRGGRPRGSGPVSTSWRSGQSGNPHGRPRGFAGVAAMIMRETGNGAELVEWALTVFRDTTRPHSERAAAHAWLADRGLGRPLATAELTISVGDGARRDFSQLTDAEIRELLEQRRAIAAKVASLPLLEAGDGAGDTA